MTLACSTLRPPDPPERTWRLFLGLTSGMARRLVTDAGSRLLAGLEEIFDERDSDLGHGEEAGQAGPMVSVTPRAVGDGMSFLSEVEERFGPRAAGMIWRPDGLPTPAEIRDPVGWAARVLLEDPLW